MTRVVRQSRRPRPTARRGLVLPLVLIVMAVAIILGMCFLTSASTSTTLASAADQRLRARMIAESGLAMTLTYIETDYNWRTDRANGEWVTNQSLDGGTVTVSGHDGDRVDATGAVVGDGSLADDATDPVVITAVGVYGDARYVARAVRTPPQAYGVVANERVEIKRNALVDSYDPSLGAYTPATATQKAVAKANGTARRPYITMRHNSRVNGNVLFAPSGTALRALDIKDSAVITGTKTALPMAVDTTEITDPGWPVDGTGVYASYSSGTTTLTGDLWCDSFTLSGSATLRVLGNVNVYVDGDFNATDTAKIEIGTPAPFGAAVKTTITMQPGTRVDAYNSSAGPYGGTNVLDGPLLATNQTAAGSISIGGAVSGDAHAGPAATVTTAISVTGLGTLGGARRALFAAMTFPAAAAQPTLPTMLDIDASVLPYTVAVDQQVSKLRASSGSKVIISGNRVLRVTDEFRLDGGALEILPGSSLTLYLGTNVRIENSGVKINAALKEPSKCIIHTTATALTIGSDTEAYALIDAPNATLSLESNAQLYGAFMGNALSLKNSAQLHMDRNPAVATAAPRMCLGYAPGHSLTVYAHNKVTIQKSARLNTNTVNPSCFVINHFGGESMDVRDDARVYARAYVPEMSLNISGATTRWFGRIEARDFTVSNSAQVTADDTGGPSRPGIIIEETIELRDSAVINGAGGTALLASHGATDTTIWIKDYSTFKGDGYTAPGGNPDDEIRTTKSGVITGVKRAQVVAAPVTALTSPAIVGSPSDRTISGTSKVTITGDLYYRKFEVKDDAVVTVDKATRLILTGDFRMSRNAKIVLNPKATLTVYCPSYPWVLDNAQVNVGGHPGKVTLSFPNALLVYMGKTSKICGTVLAPKAIVYVTDSAELYGGLTGRRITLDRYAKIHCAESLPGPVTWLEQE